jgi:hypothetical protein
MLTGLYQSDACGIQMRGGSYSHAAALTVTVVSQSGEIFQAADYV